MGRPKTKGPTQKKRQPRFPTSTSISTWGHLCLLLTCSSSPHLQEQCQSGGYYFLLESRGPDSQNREITSSLSFPLLFLFFNYNICSRQNNTKKKGIRIQSFLFVWCIRTQAYSSSMMELMHVDQHGSQTF